MNGGMGVGLLFQLVIAILLWRWGRSLSRRRGGLLLRILTPAPLVALGLNLIGFTLTVFGLIQAFGAVADVEPSMKATTLARGISHAMWAAAISLALSTLIYFVCLIAFIAIAARGDRRSA